MGKEKKTRKKIRMRKPAVWAGFHDSAQKLNSSSAGFSGGCCTSAFVTD